MYHPINDATYIHRPNGSLPPLHALSHCNIGSFSRHSTFFTSILLSQNSSPSCQRACWSLHSTVDNTNCKINLIFNFCDSPSGYIGAIREHGRVLRHQGLEEGRHHCAWRSGITSGREKNFRSRQFDEASLPCQHVCMLSGTFWTFNIKLRNYTVVSLSGRTLISL